MRFYWVRPVRYKITIQEDYRWTLPGVHCPSCGARWSAGALSLPCVDLSGHPDAATLAKPHLEEDFNEFLRLRESVRSLAPKGIELKPGTKFGPAIGPARGTDFGAITMGFPWMMLVRPEGLALLEAEGLRGLRAGPTEFGFHDKPQHVLELQIEPQGRVHPDCLPEERRPPCSTCGRTGLALPQPLLLALASLPSDRDVFRLADFSQVIAVTERFVEVARKLGCDKELAFVELAAR